MNFKDYPVDIPQATENPTPRAVLIDLLRDIDAGNDIGRIVIAWIGKDGRGENIRIGGDHTTNESAPFSRMIGMLELAKMTIKEKW